MAGTRSSARQAEKAQQSSPPSSATKSNNSTGTKRKASAEDQSSSPSANKAKRGRPSKASKEQAQKQQTLEETIPNDDERDTEMKDSEEVAKTGEADGDPKEIDSMDQVADSEAHDDGNEKSKNDKESKVGTNGEQHDEESKDATSKNAFDQVKADEGDDGKTSKKEQSTTEKDGNDAKGTENAVQEDKKREEALPSNILEKGVIYFFTRGRVGVEDPNSVQDVARSYFVMRPLPDGAKITDGAIQDLKNNRLLALPKKVWPKSGKDRFMVFVEKAQTTNKELKEEFFSGSEYSTKTLGTRQTPDVTPLGEGVYAMTTTGGGQGTTHLAYMLTIPNTIDEVQKDVGLAAKGSFVISLKNPESPGPANAQLPQSPNYPKEFIEEFGGRAWMPAHPKHLDYANAQMLLIGEDFDSSSNLDAKPEDEKDEKKITPETELKKLEEEDESRVTNLKGDDTIFADLQISSKEYPKIKTTW